MHWWYQGQCKHSVSSSFAIQLKSNGTGGGGGAGYALVKDSQIKRRRGDCEQPKPDETQESCCQLELARVTTMDQYKGNEDI